MQVALIIEGVFFYSLSLPEFIPGCTYMALLSGSVCLLAFLPGATFSPPAKRCQILNLSSNVVVGDPDYSLTI